jgi:hypothetical protein
VRVRLTHSTNAAALDSCDLVNFILERWSSWPIIPAKTNYVYMKCESPDLNDQYPLVIRYNILAPLHQKYYQTSDRVSAGQLRKSRTSAFAPEKKKFEAPPFPSREKRVGQVS